jgi:hypothetical protein
VEMSVETLGRNVMLSRIDDKAPCRPTYKQTTVYIFTAVLLMTQVVDFSSTFLINTILNTIFYFCGRGVRGCEESIYSI